MKILVLVSRLLLIFGVALSSLHAQSYTFQQFTTEDGLPDLTIYHCNQDSAGYMWFATPSGVCRFDGNEFKTYSTLNGLTGNDVIEIAGDHQGRTWFFPHYRAPCYFQNDSFITYSAIIGGEENIIVESYCDNRGNLWIARYFGEISRIGPDLSFHNYPRTTSGYEVPKRFSETKKGEIFYGLRDSLFFLSENGIRKQPASTSWPKAAELTRGRLFQLPSGLFLGILNGTLYLSEITKAGLVPVDSILVDPKAIVASHYALKNDSTIWIGYSEGIMRVKVNKRILGSEGRFLKGKSVSSLYSDKTGNLWITTLHSGVFLLTFPAQRVRNFNAGNGLSQDIIRAITRGHGNTIWMGNEEGEIELFSCDRVKKRYELSPEIKGSNRIRSILRIGKEELIVLHQNKFGQGLWHSKGGGTYYAMGYGTPKCMYYSPDHGLCLGTRKGVFIISGQIFSALEEFKQAEKAGADSQAFWDSYKILSEPTYSITQDEEGALWIGSTSGIFKYENEQIVSMASIDPFFGEVSEQVLAGKNGAIWIGTRGNGIGHWQDSTLITLSESDGLISNACNSLLVDGDSVIWVGTSRGISRVPWHAGKFDIERIRNYGRPEGLLSSYVNDLLKIEDTLYVATMKGLSVFPDHTPSTPPAKVYIQGIKVNGKHQRMDSLYRLSHSQNYLDIDFVGIYFQNPTLLKYRHKMEGVDKEWVTSSQRTLSYPNLAPGRYRFRVYALNGHNQPSIRPAMVSFVISPAWWQRTGIYWIAAILLLLLSGIIVYLQVKAKERRMELKQNLLEAKQKSLQTQMNPHFLFNTMNAIQATMNQGKLNRASDAMAEFGGLIRKMLLYADHDEISLREELDFLSKFLALSQFRLAGKLSFKIEIDPGVDQLKVFIPPLILQPFVENGINHGILPKKDKGNLEIKFLQENGRIICRIQDDGIGRERAKKLCSHAHTGKGIALTLERIRLINEEKGSDISFEIEDLMDETGIGCGTLVSVNFPQNSFNTQIDPKL